MTVANDEHSVPAGLVPDRRPPDLSQCALRVLPPRLYEALWLVDVKGLSPEGAGERLGLSAAEVMALAARARRALRRELLRAGVTERA